MAEFLQIYEVGHICVPAEKSKGESQVGSENWIKLTPASKVQRDRDIRLKTHVLRSFGTFVVCIEILGNSGVFRQI